MNIMGKDKSCDKSTREEEERSNAEPTGITVALIKSKSQVKSKSKIG